VSIEHVLETHNHADHVSGHGRLAAATGAAIHIHEEAGADYEHEPFDHGWELELGSVRIRALHTPGHRPEHTAFALIDSARGEEPWAVLTGDTLFVGDIARPDLAVDKREGARDIYRSLHEQLLALAPETEVWPGHLGGSLCGGPGMDLKVSSTVGYERRHNELLGIEDEDAFVERTTASLQPQPPNFETIVELNKGPLLREGVDSQPLAPRQVEVKRAEDALIVDVRTLLQFDEAHIPDSVSITMLQAGFGSRLAWIADPDRETVFVGRDDDDGRRATELAAAIGVRSVAGFLSGGMTSWREEQLPTERIERIAVEDLHDRSERDPSLQILDVRERSEWDAGHIPDSTHRPYHDLDHVPDGLDPSRPIAAICGSGERSGVAASLLRRLGASEVLHVTPGGVGTWARAGYPVRVEDSAGRPA
jgi:rhodanese-related sulfurtransferase/glyoxylase-like metal-dependent hydrolase (beta-lactamase superfamily II)